VLHLRKGDVVSAVKVLYDIHDYGYSVIDVMESLFGFVKMSDNFTEEEKYRIIVCFCRYITYFYTTHENIIELAFFTRAIYPILGPVRPL
jgi:hypothetical protein